MVTRIKQNLNTLWDYRIGKGEWQKREVPFSAHPVGESECHLRFNREGKGDRAFLIFEGITYAASLVMNGEDLGDMLPYCEYRFDVTEILRDTDNDLTVSLRDIDPVFGPSEGWENYGGIIRPVWLEYTADHYMTDVVWSADLNEDFSEATCHIRTESVLPTTDAVLRYTLHDATGRLCAEGALEEGKTDFVLSHPLLWSPAMPNLYSLTVSIVVNGECVDVDSRKVGIKSFVTKGKRFYLNGEPIFLVGVCRHDTWGDVGHTMTEEQMRYDMEMIKAQGVNYVRLVHYPHHKRILELADEMGLLVSEEPGLWWSDMKNPILCRDSLDVLKRTVIRDRSHVSVAFWLAFNECVFTAEFIRDSGRICRENDPTRLVSGANCMSIEMTKQFFTENGFDFYTMHPYADNTGRMWDSVTQLDDKPLIFTEWGGYMVWQNEDLFARFIRDMVTMWRNSEDKPVLSGAAIWCWSDIYEFSRMEPACHDGILYEGLTDLYRKPHSHFSVFKREFDKLYYAPEVEYSLTLSEYGEMGNFRTVSLMPEGYDAERAWKVAKSLCDEKIERYPNELKGKRHVKKGPALPKPVNQLGSVPFACLSMPLIGTKEGVTVTVGARCRRMIVLGNVSLPYGFPSYGAYGEPVAVYEINYTDGTAQTVLLRNGYEVTTAFCILGPSRIDPRAAKAPRAMSFSYDYDSEQYCVNRMDIQIDPDKTVASLTLRTLSEKYSLLLYALTVEEETE